MLVVTLLRILFFFSTILVFFVLVINYLSLINFALLQLLFFCVYFVSQTVDNWLLLISCCYSLLLVSWLLCALLVLKLGLSLIFLLLSDASFLVLSVLQQLAAVCSMPIILFVHTIYYLIIAFGDTFFVSQSPLNLSVKSYLL